MSKESIGSPDTGCNNLFIVVMALRMRLIQGRAYNRLAGGVAEAVPLTD